MQVEIADFLSPRIVKHCLPLYRDGYYGEAAHKAMTQVELALKEKGEIANSLFGVRLVRRLLGPGQSVKLRVSLGDDLQHYAATLFEGAFAYYRNYTAHDGSKIDRTICLRILVLASELLDLIDASSLSYADLGGMEGLLQMGIFESSDELLGLLEFLDGYAMPDGVYGGFFETMYLKKGFTESQYYAVIELDMVRYQVKDVVIPPEMMVSPYPEDSVEIVGWFELTDLGKKVLSEARQLNGN